MSDANYLFGAPDSDPLDRIRRDPHTARQQEHYEAQLRAAAREGVGDEHAPGARRPVTPLGRNVSGGELRQRAKRRAFALLNQANAARREALLALREVDETPDSLWDQQAHDLATLRELRAAPPGYPLDLTATRLDLTTARTDDPPNRFVQHVWDPGADFHNRIFD